MLTINLIVYKASLVCYGTNEGDATLTFLEKSHAKHKKFAKDFNITEKSDWYKLDDEEYKYYIEDLKCKRKNIICIAGFKNCTLW